MNLQISDSFTEKDELIECMKKYATENKINYKIVEAPRSISVVCKGNEEYGCEAGVTASYRKKDKKYIIKKVKINHKCPITDSSFTSTDDYIRSEIYKNIGNTPVRIGDIVSILNGQGIKTTYSNVWNILREGTKTADNEQEVDEKENKANRGEIATKKRKIDDIAIDMYAPENSNFFNSEFIDKSGLKEFDKNTFAKFHEYNEILEEFCRELYTINNSKVNTFYYGKLFFYSVPAYYNILLPIVEIKYYRRPNGVVIYGLLYDPLFEPVIYACLVSDSIDNNLAFTYFLKSLPDTFFIVEYDPDLIKLLESMKIDYFIKTRDICKHIYEEDKDQSNIENIWVTCNSKSTPISQFSWINSKHYLKNECEQVLMSLNNLPECDLDFIMYSIYNFPFIECINAIIKLSNDNLKSRKKFTVTDPKSLFGNNVISKLERNKSIRPSSKLNVDLDTCVCECGKFQEYLIPCEHACEAIRELGRDPYLYVSTLYSREMLFKLDEIIPVMDISVKCQPDRLCGRKGPGRPKKGILRDSDFILNVS